jgi:hypothetical protein
VFLYVPLIGAKTFSLAQGMRLVAVSGQMGPQDVTDLSYKQATGVFKTAGRPVTLTMSLPPQRQGSVAEQAQDALDRLQQLQATMLAQAAPPSASDIGAGDEAEAEAEAEDETEDEVPPVSDPNWTDGLEVFWHLRMRHMLRMWHEAAREGMLAAPADAPGGGFAPEEGLPGPIIVLCPEGVHEGQRLIVTAADGRELEIEVPPGVFSGDEFEIQMDE